MINTIYVVIRPGGEKAYLDKETREEVLAWAKGLNVTILEYRLVGAIHPPASTARTAEKRK